MLYRFPVVVSYVRKILAGLSNEFMCFMWRYSILDFNTLHKSIC